MICTISDCDNKVKAKGWCDRHYQTWKRNGDPLKYKYTRHGLYYVASIEYKTWVRMKNRCYNENNQMFKNYGGRGIKVCERWKHSFVNFYKDMGDRPSAVHSLERINNDSDYTPQNCKWATALEQASNRRPRVDNTSGYTGIRKSDNGKWQVRFQRNNRQIHVGTFKSLEDAIEAKKSYGNY